MPLANQGMAVGCNYGFGVVVPDFLHYLDEIEAVGLEMKC
jgi:hypothetical protein